jgi:hypothetical protein
MKAMTELYVRGEKKRSCMHKRNSTLYSIIFHYNNIFDDSKNKIGRAQIRCTRDYLQIGYLCYAWRGGNSQARGEVTVTILAALASLVCNRFFMKDESYLIIQIW